MMVQCHAHATTVTPNSVNASVRHAARKTKKICRGGVVGRSPWAARPSCGEQTAGPNRYQQQRKPGRLTALRVLKPVCACTQLMPRSTSGASASAAAARGALVTWAGRGPQERRMALACWRTRCCACPKAAPQLSDPRARPRPRAPLAARPHRGEDGGKALRGGGQAQAARHLEDADPEEEEGADVVAGVEEAYATQDGPQD